MNNNIDVLEVMAHYNGLLREKALACATAWGAAEFLRGIGRDCSEAETAYHESVDDFDSLLGLTRAAITELIEAEKEYDAAEEELEAITPDMPEDEFRRINDRLRAATYRRIAAIARIGGAK